MSCTVNYCNQTKVLCKQKLHKQVTIIVNNERHTINCNFFICEWKQLAPFRPTYGAKWGTSQHHTYHKRIYALYCFFSASCQDKLRSSNVVSPNFMLSIFIMYIPSFSSSSSEKTVLKDPMAETNKNKILLYAYIFLHLIGLFFIKKCLGKERLIFFYCGQ